MNIYKKMARSLPNLCYGQITNGVIDRSYMEFIEKPCEETYNAINQTYAETRYIGYEQPLLLDNYGLVLNRKSRRVYINILSDAIRRLRNDISRLEIRIKKIEDTDIGAELKLWSKQCT